METDSIPSTSVAVAERIESRHVIYNILQSIQSPKTSDKDRKEAEAQLKSLSQFFVQHAREVA